MISEYAFVNAIRTHTVAATAPTAKTEGPDSIYPYTWDCMECGYVSVVTEEDRPIDRSRPQCYVCN